MTHLYTDHGDVHFVKRYRLQDFVLLTKFDIEAEIVDARAVEREHDAVEREALDVHDAAVRELVLCDIEKVKHWHLQLWRE